jgi:hypothetical protein
MTPIQTIALEDYARLSRKCLNNIIAGCDDSLSAFFEASPSISVPRLLTKKSMKHHGIFFSGNTWSRKLAKHAPIERDIRYFDPSCGVGDLLSAIAERICLSRSEAAKKMRAITFEGCDIHSPFASIAADQINALEKKLDIEGKLVQRRFVAEFNSADALKVDWNLSKNHCIVMNPPFQRVTAPTDSNIGSGKISAAALFLEKAILTSPAGVRIVAILPDVIRSGTRYQKLRELLKSRSKVIRFEPEGRFSASVNIDVCILVAEIAQKIKRRSPRKEQSNNKRIGDVFDVCVGTVVPYRDKKISSSRLYIDVSDAPSWGIVQPKRRHFYNGRLFQPPFVVIKRTSSPSQSDRAKATIIIGENPVMVENHLIVLSPKNKRLSTCKSVLKLLKKETTSEWLNYQIRCRHLTVKAVAEIPY